MPRHGGGPGSVHRGEAATQMAILGAGKNPVVRLESLEVEVVGGTVHFGSVGGVGGASNLGTGCLEHSQNSLKDTNGF